MSKKVSAIIAIFRDLGFNDYQLLLDEHINGLPYIHILGEELINDCVNELLGIVNMTGTHKHPTFISFHDYGDGIEFRFALIVPENTINNPDYKWYDLKELPLIYPDNKPLDFVKSAYNSLLRKNYI